METLTVNAPLGYHQNYPQRRSQSQAPSELLKQPSTSAEQNTEIANNTNQAEDAKPDKSQLHARPQELSEAELRQIKQLQVSDREVRAHEAAHMAAAGGLARGGASFSYQIGADGRTYAVGGEVSIDTSPVRDDPQATIQKAQTIRAAALAPAQPSSADHAVAAAASQLEAAARIELAAKKADEEQGQTKEDAIQHAEASGGESAHTITSTINTDSRTNSYQVTMNPIAASDKIGQQLNISA